jgi:hypothetical protein
MPDPLESSGLPSAQLVAVQIFRTQIEAELAKTALMSSGIESMLQADNGPLLAGSWGGAQFTPALSGGIKLLVRSEDVITAKEILAATGS